MIRRLIGVLATLILVLTTLALVDPGVSGAAGPPATGSVGCKISGTGNFGPKRTLAGSSTTVKIHFNDTATGGCGASAAIPGAVVTITGVTIVGSGYLTSLVPGNANSCPNYTSADTIGVVKVKFVWASFPAIAPTVVTYTGGTAGIVSGSPLDTIRFPAPSGTVAVGSGSFTPSVNPIVNLAINIVSTCGAGALFDLRNHAEFLHRIALTSGGEGRPEPAEAGQGRSFGSAPAAYQSGGSGGRHRSVGEFHSTTAPLPALWDALGTAITRVNSREGARTSSRKRGAYRARNVASPSPDKRSSADRRPATARRSCWAGPSTVGPEPVDHSASVVRMVNPAMRILDPNTGWASLMWSSAAR